MEIRGTNSIQAAHAVRMPKNVQSVENTQQVTHPDVVDQLDISAEARAASGVTETSEARAARIAEIKTQIANGTYETREKLDAAVSRLLNELV